MSVGVGQEDADQVHSVGATSTQQDTQQCTRNHKTTRSLYYTKLCPNSLLDVNIILFISILHNNPVIILNCSPLRYKIYSSFSFVSLNSV